MTIIYNVCTIIGQQIQIHQKKKVIKYAFDFAFEYYNHGIGRLYLHHLDFLLFVGKYDHLQCVQSYWTAKSIPSGQTELHLDEFTGLVNWISTKNNYVVEEFLEKRIAVAKVINDAYNLAYVHYGVVQEKGFSEFQFLDFVGKDITNELLVYHYWIANHIPPKNRGNIFFKEFADLVNLIIFKRYDLIKFINKRMEKISS
ncbi:uncharacterized protein LOC126833867 [Adelges cooleyi]|uniref:uncharacterized protein LOC126833867 n=1 Tax=Adelges cooleyi TaxID=133065 RepID=UPI00217FAC19|nr:uncharacterized protein LOC126833867 [Adelges cooleyi]